MYQAHHTLGDGEPEQFGPERDTRAEAIADGLAFLDEHGGHFTIGTDGADMQHVEPGGEYEPPTEPEEGD